MKKHTYFESPSTKFAQIYGELSAAEMWLNGTHKRFYLITIPNKLITRFKSIYKRTEYRFIHLCTLDNVKIYAFTNLKKSSFRAKLIKKIYEFKYCRIRDFILGILLGYSLDKIIRFVLE